MKKILITAAVFCAFALSALAIPSLTAALNGGTAHACDSPDCM